MGNTPIGVMVPYIGTAAPTGWLLVAKDKTVGNSVSGADYADDQYHELFELLRNQQQNAGTEIFANGDTVKLPPLNGRAVACLDNAGGVSADVVENAAADQNGGTYGAAGHQLTVTEMPAHQHDLTADNTEDGADEQSPNGAYLANFFDHDQYRLSLTTPATMGSSSIASKGGDGSHNNVQPTLFLNWIISATSAASLLVAFSGAGLGFIL